MSVQDKTVFDDQLKNYYETVSSMDQKKSITSEKDLNNNLQYFKGKEYPISKYEIIKKSKFGKPSLNHTFTSQATFEHILVFLLKGEPPKPR